MSTRPSLFESDLPCFWIGPSMFWIRPSTFRVSPSHFSNQSFPLFQVRTSYFFESVLPQVSLSHFSSQTFPFFLVIHFCKSALLIFGLRPSHIYGSVLPTFLSQSFSFSESDLPISWVSPSHFSKSILLIFRPRSFISTDQSFHPFKVSPAQFLSQAFPFFWVSPSHFESRSSHFFGSVLTTFPSHFFSFFESDFLPIFVTVSFWILPVLCSDLIAMYTVDKIKDIGVCRNRLHCTSNSLARETNQQNTNRQARKTKK